MKEKIILCVLIGVAFLFNVFILIFMLSLVNTLIK